MFGPAIFWRERHLFRFKAQLSIITSLFVEIFVYLSAVGAIIGICIESDMFFAICVFIFAILLLVWKLLLHVSSDPDGKIKSSYYK